MMIDEENFFCPLSVGDSVPNFSFEVFHEGKISTKSIEDYKDSWLILFFYPADFTFVCPTELGELASMYDEFKKDGIEIISFSTDTAFSHKMWHETSETIKNIKYPMGSDHRQILVEAFNTYSDKDGLAYRGTFVINPKGEIVLSEIHDNSIGRSAKELLRKVRAAKFVNEHSGQVCPASWESGMDTLNPGDDLVGKI